jgi:AcrR family transcriptional regulator
MTTIDRRVARTRATLHHALLRLIIKRGYDAISVQDICEAADMGRSTFYAHYTGKGDLKRSSLDHPKAALKGYDARHEDPLGFTLALFDHGRDFVGHYGALKGGLGAMVSLEALQTVLLEMVAEALPSQGPRFECELRVRFVAGALISVLIWCLDTGAVESPEAVDALFHRLITNGV